MSSASGPNLPQGLIEALCDAQRVVTLTVSGISAESGIPTFREAQTGLWERYDPQELARRCSPGILALCGSGTSGGADS